MYGSDRQGHTTGVDKMNWQELWAAKYADGKIWQHWSFQDENKKKPNYIEQTRQTAAEREEKKELKLKIIQIILWNETIIWEWKCGLNDIRHVFLMLNVR